MCLLNASTSPPPPPPLLPGKHLCTSCMQSIILLPLCGSLHAWAIHFLVSANGTRLHSPTLQNFLDGFYMPFHAGLVASHIQLVALEFQSYTATTKGSCRPFCRVYIASWGACAYHSAIFPMDSSCWLTRAVQGLATIIQQILLVGDICFNMTTSSFFSSCQFHLLLFTLQKLYTD